jgi:uncharacterized membrane protein
VAHAIESELPPEHEPPAPDPVAPSPVLERVAPTPVEPPPVAAEPPAPAPFDADLFVVASHEDGPPEPPAPSIPAAPPPAAPVVAPAQDAEAAAAAAAALAALEREQEAARREAARQEALAAQAALRAAVRAEPAPAAGDRTLPAVAYALFLCGCFSLGLAAVPAAVLAYAQKGKAPAWVQSHYVLMIRTFWVDVVALFLGVALLEFAIGPFIWMAAGLWTAVRCAMGLKQLYKDRPYPHPQTWTV